MSNCRAKFQVTTITQTMHNKEQQHVVMEARYDESLEDKTFSVYTPSAKLEMYVNNPAVKFEVGDFYYVDFTRIDSE